MSRGRSLSVRPGSQTDREGAVGAGIKSPSVAFHGPGDFAGAVETRHVRGNQRRTG